jgi:hypothetical protein
VLRFGVALKRYWVARSRDEEAVTLLLPVLDRPEAQADPELFAAALLTAASSFRYFDIAVALQLGEQAVALARQLGNERLLIESLAALSSYCFLAGEPERKLRLGQEAVQRARQLGDDVLLGKSLQAHLMGDAIIDPADARPLFTEAIAATQRSGDQWTACILTNNAGVHALFAGDIPTARAYLHQTAQAMRAIGDEDPNASINMGWVQRQDNEPRRRASQLPASPADKPPHRTSTRYRRGQPRPGVPGRRHRQLAPGRRTPRRRPSIPRPDWTTVARA